MIWISFYVILMMTKRWRVIISEIDINFTFHCYKNIWEWKCPLLFSFHMSTVIFLIQRHCYFFICTFEIIEQHRRDFFTVIFYIYFWDSWTIQERFFHYYFLYVLLRFLKITGFLTSKVIRFSLVDNIHMSLFNVVVIVRGEGNFTIGGGWVIWFVWILEVRSY